MKIYFTNEAKKQWFNLEFIRIIPRPKQPQLRKKQYLCDTETSNAMKVTIILLTILVAGGAIVWLIDRLFYHKDMHEKVDETEENGTGNTSRQGCADEACGLRSICPSEQLLAGECRQEVIYYDDEELDAFAGRGADDFTDQEMEQWRDVLYTLQPADLLGWGQSIKHRGLTMPAPIKDEFLQLAAEHRLAKQ